MDLIINPKLEALLLPKPWLTPYIAYERVRQLLMPYYMTIKSMHLWSEQAGKIVLPLMPRLRQSDVEYLHFAYKLIKPFGSYEVSAKISDSDTISEEEQREFLDQLNEDTINELSKRTLRLYRDKADTQAGDIMGSLKTLDGYEDNNSPFSTFLKKKLKNRSIGSIKAERKLHGPNTSLTKKH